MAGIIAYLNLKLKMERLLIFSEDEYIQMNYQLHKEDKPKNLFGLKETKFIKNGKI